MSEKSIYAGVTNVVQLHSHTSKPCTICKKHVDLVDGINHYVNDHDYKILHIGTETDSGDDGPEHCTTAVLGK